MSEDNDQIIILAFLNFCRLHEIMFEKTSVDGETTNNIVDPQDITITVQDYKDIIRLIGTEENSVQPVVLLRSLVDENQITSNVFLLPGIEGSSKAFEQIASKLQAHVLCLQYLLEEPEDCNIEGIAKHILPVSVRTNITDRAVSTSKKSY